LLTGIWKKRDEHTFIDQAAQRVWLPRYLDSCAMMMVGAICVVAGWSETVCSLEEECDTGNQTLSTLVNPQQ